MGGLGYKSKHMEYDFCYGSGLPETPFIQKIQKLITKSQSNMITKAYYFNTHKL